MAEFSKYAIFCKVAELGNITKAAKELNYTQSAVSHVINETEDKMGFPLVIRSKSGVTLTDAGMRVLAPIQQIARWENVLAQTVSAIRDVAIGTLRVGFFCGISSVWLPQIVKRFSEESPDVEFEFVFDESEGIADKLINDKVDCGFILRSNSEGLSFFPLCEDDYCVVLPLGHPLAKNDRISLHDLQSEAFVMPGNPSNELLNILSSHDIHPKYRMSDDYGAVALVEQGLGVSILTMAFLGNISGDIIVRPLDAECTRTVGIAIHSLKYATPAARRFVEYARLSVSQFEAMYQPL